jgi:hypothetical protein
LRLRSDSKPIAPDTDSASLRSEILDVSYLRDSLSQGESIIQRFSFHWVVWIRIWFLYLVALGLPVGLYLVSQDVRALYAFAISLPMALGPHLRLKFTEYGLTNRRVVFKKGIIARITEEMKISTIEIKQTMTGRLIGFGDIHVSGVGVSDVLFSMIRDPMAAKRKIEEQRYEQVR